MRQEQNFADSVLTVSGGTPQSPAAKVSEDLPRRIVSRRAGHAAAWMCSGAAHVEPRQRSAIVAIPEHRPRRQHLVELQPAVKDVAAHEAEGPLEVERAHDLPPENGRPEIRRDAVDRVDHEVRNALAMRIP